MISDYNFNSLVYGVNQADVGLAIQKCKRIFLAETSAADRRAIVNELGIEAVLLEAESPLFWKPEAELFGAGAKDRMRGVDWRLVEVKSPRPAEN